MGNGPYLRSTGSSSYPKTAIGAHNFERIYSRHCGASGDVRFHYGDLEFTSTGSGEYLRARGVANTTGCAAGGTINAAHFTGRVASGATVSGALNAARCTLEVAGTTPTPGGTLAALQLDTNISTGWTAPTAAFLRVTNSGAGKVTKFAIFDALGNHDATDVVVMETAASVAATDITRMVKCQNGSEVFYLYGGTQAPKAS
jgi:hypothetical protein